MARDNAASSAVAPSQPTLAEQDAATYIGFTPSFLRAKRAGVGSSGPPFVRIGRSVRYRICDLDAWLEEHLVGATKRARAARSR